jgi:hypothetical protein
VIGLTDGGVEVNVKLRIDDKYKDLKNAPSIIEFSREDRKALSPCIATKDNGPSKREGILLFSECEPDGETKAGLPSYIARWAVVLAEDSNSQDPVFGFGRIAVRKDTVELKKARAQIETLGTGPAKVELEKKLSDPSSYLFPAVIYHPEDKIEIRHSGGLLRDAIILAADKYHRRGITGGLLLSSKVTGRYKEAFRAYSPSSKGYQSSEELADQLLAELPLTPSQEIEIMPAERINCGPKGNEYYAKAANYNAIKSFYYSPDEEERVCKVVARVSYYEDSNNTLLSRLYPLSPPICKPSELRSEGSSEDQISIISLSSPTCVSDTGRNKMFDELTSTIVLTDPIETIDEVHAIEEIATVDVEPTPEPEKKLTGMAAYYKKKLAST